MILLTGCAGFIGSRVAELLLQQGHTVVGVDNLNDAYDPRLKLWRLDRLKQQSSFRFVEADISNRAAVQDVMDGSDVEAVVNLAARAGVRQSTANPWVYIDTNVTGTLNLLEACRHRGIGKFILASTSSLYGARTRGPFRESDESSRPISPYAASKKAAEALLHSYAALYDIDATVLRYFTVYGPAGRPDMSLFRFVRGVIEGTPITVFGDGTQERDFTHVEDVARGTVAALRPMDGFEIINLGSDRPVSVNQAVRTIEEVAGASAKVQSEPRHVTDVPATWADITKARDLLGWEPRVDFHDGVESVVRWYRENRSWAKDVQG